MQDEYVGVSSVSAIEMKPLLVFHSWIHSNWTFIHALFPSRIWVPTVPRRSLWHFQIINPLEFSTENQPCTLVWKSTFQNPLIDLRLNCPPRSPSVECFEGSGKKKKRISPKPMKNFSSVSHLKCPGRGSPSSILHNIPNFVKKFPEIRQGVRGEWTRMNLLEEHLPVFPDNLLDYFADTPVHFLFQTHALRQLVFDSTFCEQNLELPLGGFVPDTLPIALWRANGRARICVITSLCKWQ